MQKSLYLAFLIAGSLLLSSCDKEEHNGSETDFSIESDLSFELLSQYPNGWIKEGRITSFYQGEDVPSNEFEYYENGNIQSAKLYTTYPQQHLYMEVSRSEDNKPLWSKYYTPEGDLWFETEYDNGLPSVKKVYSEKGTAVHTYTNGDLISVEFTTADNKGTSTTVYDRTAGTRKVIITQDGETVMEEEYQYENYGDGVISSNEVPTANPFEDTEGSYRKLLESFFQNPHWEYSADPIEYINPYRTFSEFYVKESKFATEFAVSSDLYQSIIEQYPVTEDEVLIQSYKFTEGVGSFLPPFEERRALQIEMEQNPSLFELKYGNEYVEEIYFGKNIFIIGALRNMPTSTSAANEIKILAQKHMNAIINGKDQLSTEEMGILDKVWFEVKFFSTLQKHRNGVVLNTTEDYNAAAEEVFDAESSVVQLQYVPFDHMISD
jgi:hypothetical protein